jgi:hypothetical protein
MRVKNKLNDKELHPMEDKLLKFIRQLKNGRLFLKVRDGLPMAAEVTEGQKVIFNSNGVKDA